tara:strand:+ start:1226 stop:1393 length:168 start_codon:yes stop_codon:yes gene_type:complete
MINALQLGLGLFMMFGAVGSLETGDISFGHGVVLGLLGCVLALDAASEFNFPQKD